MGLDREIACDSAVLEMLKEQEYSGYGYTLLDLAEKNFFFSFSCFIRNRRKKEPDTPAHPEYCRLLPGKQKEKAVGDPGLSAVRPRFF